MANGGKQPGPGVDAQGNPVFDPTANVISLVEAESRRQDDLRAAAKELSDVKNAHVKEIGDLRAVFQKQISDMRERHAEALRKAEADRLDSIRQVDREDVNKTAAQALSAIQTLASTTNTTAETLRTQVATTAQATATTLTNITGEINKRLSALELSSSEGKGKQTVADPMLENLYKEMRSLNESRAGGAGRDVAREKTNDNTKWLIGLAIAIAGLVAAWVLKQ